VGSRKDLERVEDRVGDFEGFLIVADPSNPGVDTGLRFSAVDEGKGQYRCPKCGEEVTVPESEI
jgi:hypothetical protein